MASSHFDEKELYEEPQTFYWGTLVVVSLYLWHRLFNTLYSSLSQQILGAFTVVTLTSFAGMSWPGPLSHLILSPTEQRNNSSVYSEPALLSYVANTACGVITLLTQFLLVAEPFRFVSHKVTSVAATVAMFICVHSLWEGVRDPCIVKQSVTLPRLPQSLDGLRIVQITDLHVGLQMSTVGRTQMKRVVKMVNALEPDVVAITGDLIDGFDEPSALSAVLDPLAALRAPLGKYFVTGNHEYYFGSQTHRVLQDLEGRLSKMGIVRLANERVSIEVGGGAEGSSASFDLAGIDDLDGTGNLTAALEGRDEDKELLLLSHQPNAIYEAAAAGVGLQLSGHTHGGQMFPVHIAASWSNQYWSGYYTHVAESSGHATHLYVSRGTKQGGAPMRLLAQTEITQFTLRSAAVAQTATEGGGSATDGDRHHHRHRFEERSAEHMDDNGRNCSTSSRAECPGGEYGELSAATSTSNSSTAEDELRFPWVWSLLGGYPWSDDNHSNESEWSESGPGEWEGDIGARVYGCGSAGGMVGWDGDGGTTGELGPSEGKCAGADSDSSPEGFYGDYGLHWMWSILSYPIATSGGAIPVAQQ